MACQDRHVWTVNLQMQGYKLQNCKNKNDVFAGLLQTCCVDDFMHSRCDTGKARRQMATQTGHKILGRNDLGGLGSLYCDGKSMKKLYQNRFSSRLFVATILYAFLGIERAQTKNGSLEGVAHCYHPYMATTCVCVCGLQANLEANAA